MADVGLTAGWLTIVLPLLGLAALLWLIIGPPRHLRRAVPIALAAGVLVGFGAKILIDDVFNPWGAPLDWRIYFFAGVVVIALVLLIPRLLSSRRWYTRLLSPLAALLVILAAAGQINQVFGYYPTLGSLWGDNGVSIENSLPDLNDAALTAQTPTVRQADWNPPADMPTEGKVVKVQIPGTASGLTAGDSFIYIPPAAQVATPANVPVLVLIHGNPGGSADWLTGGRIAQELDAYAAKNKGLAPLVVMADASGNFAPNWPLCMNSNVGQGATYLSVDVPNYVKENFSLGLGSARQFAIGGFSYGGTCALQLGVGYPQTYPTFLMISGEKEQTLPGGPQKIIDTYFGGNQAAYEQSRPLQQLKTTKLNGSAGIVVVGGNDAGFKEQGQQAYQALKAAGADVQLQTLPGGHSWDVWRPGLTKNLDWLMQRFGVK